MNVRRPLVSVKVLVRQGHSVVMTPGKSYILAKGKRIPIYEKDGVFVLPVWFDGDF